MNVDTEKVAKELYNQIESTGAFIPQRERGPNFSELVQSLFKVCLDKSLMESKMIPLPSLLKNASQS